MGLADRFVALGLRLARIVAPSSAGRRLRRSISLRSRVRFPSRLACRNRKRNDYWSEIVQPRDEVERGVELTG